MVDFRQRLRALRLRDGLTQWQLAERIGLTQAVISAYETGLRLPSYSILLKLAHIFQVTTDYLLGMSVHSGTTLDLSGLTQAQCAVLQRLAEYMRR